MIINGYIPSVHLFSPMNNWLKLTSPTNLSYFQIKSRLKKYPKDSRYPIVISSKNSKVIFLNYIVLTNEEPILTLEFKTIHGVTYGIIWGNNFSSSALDGILEIPLLLEGALTTPSAIYYYVRGRLIHIIRNYRQLSPIELMNQVNLGFTSVCNLITLEK